MRGRPPRPARRGAGARRLNRIAGFGGARGAFSVASLTCEVDIAHGLRNALTVLVPHLPPLLGHGLRHLLAVLGMTSSASFPAALAQEFAGFAAVAGAKINAAAAPTRAPAENIRMAEVAPHGPSNT